MNILILVILVLIIVTIKFYPQGPLVSCLKNRDEVHRVFLRHRRSENNFSVYHEELSGKWSIAYDYFFSQMWSLFKNILLQRYTFLRLLEFLMKTLGPHSWPKGEWSVDSGYKIDFNPGHSCFSIWNAPCSSIRHALSCLFSFLVSSFHFACPYLRA